MSRFAAVLFDLDGTLLDTLADIAAAMNQVLREEGYPQLPVERYRFLVGDGVETLVRRCLALGGVTAGDDEVGTLAARMRRWYRARLTVATRPYDGVPELLAALAAAGIPTTVLSNKPHDLTTALVARFFPDHPFALVQGAQPQVPKKPAPAAPLAQAAALGVAPERVLYLGDTDTDMRCARCAGMYPVGAAWGFRPAMELQRAGARRLAYRPCEVAALAVSC